MKELPELPYFNEFNTDIEYHHDGDAGIDLAIWDTRLNNGEISTNGYIDLKPRESATLKTGLHLAIPENHFGFLDSRSSTSKKKLDLLCRTIDSPFRGNIRLAIINLGTETVRITNGDELFQIIIMPYAKVSSKRFNTLEDFMDYAGETSRGDKGFGSKELNKSKGE